MARKRRRTTRRTATRRRRKNPHIRSRSGRVFNTPTLKKPPAAKLLEARHAAKARGKKMPSRKKIGRRYLSAPAAGVVLSGRYKVIRKHKRKSAARPKAASRRAAARPTSDMFDFAMAIPQLMVTNIRPARPAHRQLSSGGGGHRQLGSGDMSLARL